MKNNINAVIRIIITTFYIIFMGWFFYSLIYEVPSYKKSLSNGYYIYYTDKKTGSKLMNDNYDIMNKENYPNKRILKTIEKDEYIFVWDELQNYYIINTKTNDINGPHTKEEFMDMIKENDYYELLSWDYGYTVAN